MAQFGSLVNSISGSSSEPEVGMGATILMWSDRHAATIVGVSASGKTVKVQRDKATRTDSNGMSDSQSWEFAPDTEASVQTYSKRKNGRFVLQGCTSAPALAIGYRSEYYDYSF